MSLLPKSQIFFTLSNGSFKLLWERLSRKGNSPWRGLVEWNHLRSLKHVHNISIIHNAKEGARHWVTPGCKRFSINALPRGGGGQKIPNLKLFTLDVHRSVKHSLFSLTISLWVFERKSHSSRWNDCQFTGGSISCVCQHFILIGLESHSKWNQSSWKQKNVIWMHKAQSGRSYRCQQLQLSRKVSDLKSHTIHGESSQK